MSVGAQVRVGRGGTFDREGLGFGGVNLLSAQDGEPTRVTVCVWTKGVDERDFELSLGETFEFAGQKWRLDKINDRSYHWSATLTRVG